MPGQICVLIFSCCPLISALAHYSVLIFRNFLSSRVLEMNASSPFSLSHASDATGSGKPFNDSVSHMDVFHAHSSDIFSRQQSLPSQQCRVSRHQCHSETDVGLVAAQPSFSSETAVKCQKRPQSPQHCVISVLPSPGSATFLADRGFCSARSATSPSWHRALAEPLHAAADPTRIATRGGPVPSHR